MISLGYARSKREHPKFSAGSGSPGAPTASPWAALPAEPELDCIPDVRGQMERLRAISWGAARPANQSPVSFRANGNGLVAAS
jgi:hypothetical protein